MLNQVKGPFSSNQVPKSGKWPLSSSPSFLRSGMLSESTGLDRCSQPGDPSSTSVLQRQVLSSQGF